MNGAPLAAAFVPFGGTVVGMPFVKSLIGYGVAHVIVPTSTSLGMTALGLILFSSAKYTWGGFKVLRGAMTARPGTPLADGLSDSELARVLFFCPWLGIIFDSRNPREAEDPGADDFRADRRSELRHSSSPQQLAAAAAYAAASSSTSNGGSDSSRTRSRNSRSNDGGGGRSNDRESGDDDGNSDGNGEGTGAPEDALAVLTAMGFGETESTAALQATGYDIEAACKLLCEQGL